MAPSRLMAQRLQELAREALDRGEGAGDAPILLANELLSQATRLAPDDPELWRLYIETLDALNQTDGIREALASYLRAAPKDDAAQLRMVRLIVAGQQTVAGRAEVLERMASATGSEKLGTALRSRLAWQAAELRRNQGLTKKFHSLLRVALEQDPSNAAAARSTYELFAASDRVDLLDRTKALRVWHTADPANPSVVLRIAQTLLHCGQYEDAAEWYGAADALLAYQGGLGPGDSRAMAADWAIAMWGKGRADDAINFLRVLSGEPVTARMPPGKSSATADTAPNHGDATSQNTKPEALKDNRVGKAVELPADLQSILTALYTSSQRSEAARAAFQRLDAQLAHEGTHDPDLLAARIWARLLFNQSVAEAEPWVKQLSGKLEPGDPRRTRLNGWLLLRTGHSGEAREALVPLAGTDAPSALGLALCESEKDKQIKQLQAAQRLGAANLVGVMARDMLRRLGGKPEMGPACEAVGRLAGQVPGDLRRIAEPTTRFVSLRVTPMEAHLRYGQPVAVGVQLTNLSDLPLSVGPEGVVPTTVLLIPRLMVSQNQWKVLAPQVLDLYRAIRLEPGDSISAEVRLAGSDLTSALDENPAQAVQLAVEAVLNPRMDTQGKYQPGLLGSRVMSRRFDRPAQPATATEVDGAIARLSGDEGGAMLAAAWLVRSAASLPADQSELAGKAIGAIRELYERSDGNRRAWIVGFIPDTEQARQRFAPIIDGASRSKDLVEQYALLMALGGRVDAPELTAALRAQDGPVRKFAENWRAVLVEAAKPRIEDVKPGSVETKPDTAPKPQAGEPRAKDSKPAPEPSK